MAWYMARILWFIWSSEGPSTQYLRFLAPKSHTLNAFLGPESSNIGYLQPLGSLGLSLVEQSAPGPPLRSEPWVQGAPLPGLNVPLRASILWVAVKKLRDVVEVTTTRMYIDRYIYKCIFAKVQIHIYKQILMCIYIYRYIRTKQQGPFILTNLVQGLQQQPSNYRGSGLIIQM